MSDIVEFFNGKFKVNDLTIYEYLEKDYDYWEGCHNFIQWLFPNDKPSEYNLEAPVLTKEDIEIFKDAKYLLLIIYLEDFFIDFIKNRDMSKFNHNHLRITRVLRFLKLTRGKDWALETLIEIIKIPKLFVDPKTLTFWIDAVTQ